MIGVVVKERCAEKVAHRPIGREGARPIGRAAGL
jgi:hypothetical protein